MDSKSAAKVGIFILFTFALGVVVYFALAHIDPNTYTVKVSFADTKGLQRQSVVRMQGVAVGEVTRVELDTDQRPPRPVVTLSIRNDFGIPEGSTFRIVSGILITNPQVEIEPSLKRTLIARNSRDILKGAEGGSALDALSPELSQTVSKLNETFEEMNQRFATASDKINRILDQTETLLATTNRAARTGERLISDPEVQNSLKSTVGNFEKASAQVVVTSRDLSARLNEVLSQSSTSLDTLTNNLSNILGRIDTTLDDANTVVKKLTEQVTDPRLQNTLQETADLARTTLARFNQIASDLHQITGDPQLQNNLRQTVQNLQNATEQGEQAVKRINDLIGKLTGETTGGGAKSSLRLPQVDFVANISEQIDPARLRVDAEARIGLGNRDLLNVGAYDFGGNTRLIFQGGRQINESLMARYGLYASKLGLGLEWKPNTGTGFRADLWDANRPQLDLRALFRVNNDASVWIGADGLFRGNASPIIGFQISR